MKTHLEHLFVTDLIWLSRTSSKISPLRRPYEGLTSANFSIPSTVRRLPEFEGKVTIPFSYVIELVNQSIDSLTKLEVK